MNDDLLTTDEVGALLKVSRRGVQKWIQTGALRAIRYGRLLRIRRADLEAFGVVVNERPAPLGVDDSPMPETAGAAQE